MTSTDSFDQVFRGVLGMAPEGATIHLFTSNSTPPDYVTKVKMMGFRLTGSGKYPDGGWEWALYNELPEIN